MSRHTAAAAGCARRRCDAGAGLVSVAVALALLGFAVVATVGLYSAGAATAQRSRMRVEAEAVLAWHVAEYGAAAGCPAAPPAPVVRLGPDPLTSEPGFAVRCVFAPFVGLSAGPALWPPAACAACAAGEQRLTDVLTVSVSWDSFGAARSLQRSVVVPQ